MQLGWIPLEDDYLVRLAIGVIVEFDVGRTADEGRSCSARCASRSRSTRSSSTSRSTSSACSTSSRHTLEIDATIRRGTVMGLFKITGDGGAARELGRHAVPDGDARRLPPGLPSRAGRLPEAEADPHHRRQGRTCPTRVELSASGYMAVTSNTIQFGAEFTASIKSGNWKIEGNDRRRRADPACRSTSTSRSRAACTCKYRGHNLIGVKFKGGLAGPSPLVLRGEVCISLLLFDACWSDSFELGDAGALSRRGDREPRARARRRDGARREPHRRRGRRRARAADARHDESRRGRC